MRFLLFGVGGVFIAIFMWQREGLPGKVAVIIAIVFIIKSSMVKTRSKYLEDKIKRQRDKIISERMEKRIDKLHDYLGETAIIFQKYLDESKEGDNK
jgi:hypothetical protein